MKQEHLKSVLNYDPQTGIFTWLVSPSSRAKAGARAGYVDNVYGYRHIRVFGKSYLASRLAYFYMTGSWPPTWIDHHDCIRINDAWDNLRVATPSQNGANRSVSRKLRVRGALKGACFFPRTGRWKSSLTHNKRHNHLGYFDTEQEAHDAYVIAACSIHGEFARTA